MTLQESVALFRRTHNLAGPGLVAVSGGPDSVALLLTLAQAESRGLNVGHFHHQLRGAESDADAAFVQALAESLGLPYWQGTAPVAEQSGNLEANARRLRYAWLTQTAHSIGAKWVATGHTLDDQAETLLFRLIRGTDIRGLQGIAPSRRLSRDSTILLVRPLLQVSKTTILQDLVQRQQPYRQDSSNDSTALSRNRLRHEVMPVLRSVNPHAVEHLARLAAQSARIRTELERQAARWLHRIELPRTDVSIQLDAARFERLSELMATEVLVLVWQRERWPSGDMTARHWERAGAVLRGQAKRSDFPGRIHIQRVGSTGILTPSRVPNG